MKTLTWAHVRFAAYLIAVTASLAFGAWQASDGNLTETIGGFISALVNFLAASNVDFPQAPGDEKGSVDTHALAGVALCACFVALLLAILFVPTSR